MAGPLVSVAPQGGARKMHGRCNQTRSAYAAAVLTKSPGQCFVDKCAKTTNAKRSQHQQTHPESIIQRCYTDSERVTGGKSASLDTLPEPCGLAQKGGAAVNREPKSQCQKAQSGSCRRLINPCWACRVSDRGCGKKPKTELLIEAATMSEEYEDDFENAYEEDFEVNETSNICRTPPHASSTVSTSQPHCCCRAMVSWRSQHCRNSCITSSKQTQMTISHLPVPQCALIATYGLLCRHPFIPRPARAAGLLAQLCLAGPSLQQTQVGRE
jgi:hypothetical protein